MTEILKSTPVSQVAADISAHIRSLVLARSKQTPMTELSEEVGISYLRFRYFALNAGVVPNDADLAKLIAVYMPEYRVVPSMVVPVDKVA